MGLEQDNTAPQGAAPSQGTAPPPVKREKAPRDPAALEKQNRKAAVRRVAKKLADCDDLDQLHAKVEELRGKKKPDDAAGAAQPVSTAQVQPTTPKGWPSATVIAQTVPKLYVPALKLIQRLPEKHRPQVEAFKVKKPVANPDGTVTFVEELITVDPAQELAAGCAPFVAQSTEGMQTTPAKAAIVTLATVIGVPIALTLWDAGWEAVKGWWGKRKDAQAKAASEKPAEKTINAAPPPKPQLVQGQKP